MCDGAVGGRDVGLGEALGAGLRLVPRTAVLGVASYILLFGSWIPAMLLAGIVGFVAGMADGGGAVSGVVTVVAMAAAMVVATIWWGAMAMMSLPAMVAERLGPVASLNRANSLAKGARLRSVGLGFLAWLIVVLPTLGIYFLMGIGSGLFDPQAQARMSAGQLYLQQVVGVGVGAVTTPYLIGVMVLLYYDRRVRREGYDVEVASAALTAEV
jgi:hypothetical protein